MPSEEQYLRDLSQQIGRLTAVVQNMDKRASEDRTARLALEQQLATSVDTLHDRQANHDHDIEALKVQVARIEPVVNEVTGWKARMTGALFILGLIGSAILTALALFREQVVHFAAKLFGA